jgi:hypothetical protein
MRLPACGPLLVEPGGVPFITVREIFETVMSVATEGTGALAVTTAVIAAIVTNRVKTAWIVVMTVGATAVKVKVKIVSVRSALTAVMTVGASAMVIAGEIVSVASAVIVAKPAVRIAITRPEAMWPVADTRMATAPITHAKCAAIVEENVAARKAMKQVAARGRVKSSALSAPCARFAWQSHAGEIILNSSAYSR